MTMMVFSIYFCTVFAFVKEGCKDKIKISLYGHSKLFVIQSRRIICLKAEEEINCVQFILMNEMDSLYFTLLKRFLGRLQDIRHPSWQ